MVNQTLTSYGRQDRPYAKRESALAARRAWATSTLAAGAFLVLLLALTLIVLEEGLHTRLISLQPAADHAPATLPIPEPTLVPTAAAESFPAAMPTRRHRPITRAREQDGALMVFVPAGEFWMGSDENDPKAGPLESPRHKVRVGAFWIDRTEVTNVQFRQCVDAGVCGPPQKTSSLSRVRYYKAPEYEDYPVVNVTWHQARAYAQWAGGRLPTEAEWEYAARGPEGVTYPWGEATPNEDLLNYHLNVDDTAPVGSYPAGASWCGALDMSGSVWEWTSSLLQPYPYDAADGREDPEATGRRVLRGGAFAGDAKHVRSAIRAFPAPGYWDWLGGFRVVQSSPG